MRGLFAWTNLILVPEWFHWRMMSSTTHRKCVHAAGMLCTMRLLRLHGSAHILRGVSKAVTLHAASL